RFSRDWSSDVCSSDLHGVTDFDGEIAARHHDGIGCIENFFQRRYRFGAFNLGYDQAVATGLGQQVTRPAHVLTRARERYAEEIEIGRASCRARGERLV